MNRNLTTWSGYEAGPDDGPDLLALLIGTAEYLRARRRVDGHLVCANIAINGPHDIPTARAVLDWPHWITHGPGGAAPSPRPAAGRAPRRCRAPP